MKKCRRVIAGILLLSLLFSGAPKTGLAAAETSILSAAGVTYAQTVDKDGKGFDLSEKHLENTGEGKSAKTDLFRVAEKTITVTVKVKKKG